jgi:hypothetical protein
LGLSRVRIPPPPLYRSEAPAHTAHFFIFIFALEQALPGVGEEGESPAESADVDVLQMALLEGGRSCGAAETALGQLKRSQSFA